MPIPKSVNPLKRLADIPISREKLKRCVQEAQTLTLCVESEKKRGPAERTSPPSLVKPAGKLSYEGIFEPSVAQPPLPLQEFLALHPLSLDLQPPLPLHEFLPLQACFSFTAVSAFLSVSCAVAEAFPPLSRLEA